MLLLSEQFATLVASFDRVIRCCITGKVFTEKEAEQEITETYIGSMWMGLWLGQPIIFDEHDWTLIPRWMVPTLQAKGYTLAEDQLEPASAVERLRLLERMESR